MAFSFLRYYLTLITFILIPNYLFSQKIRNDIISLSANKELSGNNINEIYQDKKGFIWIASANGLDRYDGNYFQHFSNILDSNSPGQIIESIVEDDDGIIYCAANFHGITYYKNAKWNKIEFSFNYPIITCKNILKLRFSNNMIWILTNLNLLIKLNIYSHSSTIFYFSSEIMPFKDFFIFEDKIQLFSKKNIITLIPDIQNKLTVIDTSLITNCNYIKKIIKVSHNNYIFCHEYNNFSQFIKIKEIVQYKNNVRKLLYTNSGSYNLFNIFITKHNELLIIDFPNLYFFDSNFNLKYNYKLNITISISNIISNIQTLFCDNNDLIWIGTGEAGILKLKKIPFDFKIYFNNFNSHINNIRSLILISNSLFIGTYHGKIIKHTLAKFNNNLYITNQYIFYLKNKFESPINCLLKINSNSFIFEYYYFDNFIYFYYINNNTVHKSSIKFTGKVWTMNNINDNLWIGTNYEDRRPIIIYNFLYNKLIYINFPKYYTIKSIWTIFQDSYKNIWIGTNIGLFKINNKRTGIEKGYQTIENDITSLSGSNVWHILEERPGILWIGTTDGGLNRFNIETGEFKRYTVTEGLASNMIAGMLFDKHGNIWISTANGISKFNIEHESFINYNESDGLYTNDFNFKACDVSSDGWMFWGTKSGIIYFHPDSIHSYYKAPLVISSFKIFDKVIKDALFDGDKIRLKYYQNYIQFEFSLLDFSNPGKHQFEYQLEGFDKSWIKTFLFPPSASYTNVPAGHYIFRVRTAGFDDNFQRREISINIYIKPIFWKSIYFKFLLVILFIIIILLFINYLRIKNRTRKKFFKAEIDTLRSQMNPHFIFNSLNSVLDFLINNNNKIATVFLSKFAKLIRKMLDNSKFSFITIQEEYEFLMMYLTLESMRFNKRLNYSIDISQNVNQEEELIPPMILQPIIENSIKHGFKHKKGDLKLNVTIDSNNDELLCTVIDNGIGREMAKYYNYNSLISNQKSYGTEIINSRLDLLTKIYSKKFYYEIIDLYDNNDQPLGTKVHIVLSKLTAEEIII